MNAKIVVRRVPPKDLHDINSSWFIAELTGYTHNHSVLKGEGPDEEKAIGNLFVKNREHPVFHAILSVSIELPSRTGKLKDFVVADPTN